MIIILDIRVYKDSKFWIYDKINHKDKKNTIIYILNDGDMFLEEDRSFFKKVGKNFKNILIIGVIPNNRFKEYTPWYGKRPVSWTDFYYGYGNEYLDKLIKELIPYILGKLNIPASNNIFIGGASLGGLISTYALFKYEYFKGGIFVSASYWYEGFLNYLKDTPLPCKNIYIYMDVGDKESPGRITYFKDIIGETRKVYNIFLDKGIDKEKINFKLMENMGHKKSVFIDRIYSGIDFCYKKIRGEKLV